MADAQGQSGNILLLPETEVAQGTRPPTPPPRHGEWFGQNGVVLDRLAKSLAVGQLTENVRSVDSIPDLWARPLLFADSLFNNRHPLHLNVRAEWRGLLAILALKERYRLPLYTKSLPLSESNHSKFAKVASKLRPTAGLDGNTSWEQVHLLFYGTEFQDDTEKGKVIGMASPVTLVCTAAYLEGRLDENVPWFQQGVLTDPCRDGLLGEEEKGALCFWLRELSRKLLGKYPQEQIQYLAALLQSFLDDLKNTQGLGQYQLSESSLGLNTDLYQLLDKPVQPSQITLGQSAVRLVPSEELTPQPTLLVLSSELETQWNIQHPSQVPIYGEETLASLDFDNLGDNRQILVTRTGERVVLQNAEWRKPEDFFTEKLLLVRGTDVFPGVEIRGQNSLTYKGNSVVPILPIKSQLLSYLNPSYLADNITFSVVNKNGQNEILVILKLPLVGGDFCAHYTYYKTKDIEDIYERDSLPVLAIWPNFQARNWNRYYTYYDPAGIQAQATFYAKPYPEGENLSRKVTDEQGKLQREITRSSQPPKVMLCQTWEPKLNKEVDVGCLLLKDLPVATRRQGVSWEIGVDFGTSATNIYVRSSDQNEPTEIRFENRLSPITSFSKEREGFAVNYFLPCFEPANPFFSLFRPEEQRADEGQNSYDTPFLRGNVFYMRPDEYLRDLKKIGVKSRLKWEFATFIRGFLEQLAVQCLAEAVSKGATTVNWHVSYPAVYGDAAITRQESIWEEIVGITKSMGIQSNFPDSNYKTESFASAIFFYKKDNVPLVRTICIDIGGETSDISILGGGAFLEQCSVRFAGESFFMNLFKANPQVLQFFGDESALLKLITAASSSVNFSAEMDAVLRKYRPEFLKKLADNRENKVWTNPDGQVYGLLHLIALGLSGLLYYTGLMLNYVKAKEKLDEDTLPYVCIGGNGSGTLSWLGRGTFNDRTSHNELFRNVLTAASGLNQDTKFWVRVSSNPKGEVAYGLVHEVHETDWQLGKPDERKIELSGENFLDSSGTEQGWDTNLTAALLSSGLRVPGQLSELRRFINIFNDYSTIENSLVRKIELSREDEQLLRDHVQTILNQFKNRNTSVITVEPLFILALKELMKLEIGKWLKRLEKAPK